MHTFRVLTADDEIARLAAPKLTAAGFAPPQAGAAVIFAEFDEQGEIVALLPLQLGAFVEGLWSRGGNIRKLWRMLVQHIETRCPDLAERQLLLIPSTAKVARVCELFGCEDTERKVYRRRF